MNEIKKEGAGFVGYEYKEISASGERASFYLDCYENFGWTLDERTQESAAKGKLILKRERKIMNKMELTRLQRHFEVCLDEIRALEQSKTTSATIWAIAVGLIGTVFMAGATFAAVHIPPLYMLSAILAVPGFTGWILPCFLYKKLAAKRMKAVAELMERQYDEIYEICEQGNRLLNRKSAPSHFSGSRFF